jgi:deoxyinosine 3'endonuclease (endonuclease V)
MKLLVDVPKVFVGHVGVHLSGSNIGVAQESLHRTEVCTVTKEVSRERVTNDVRSHLAGNAGERCIAFNDALHTPGT